MRVEGKYQYYNGRKVKNSQRYTINFNKIRIDIQKDTHIAFVYVLYNKIKIKIYIRKMNRSNEVIKYKIDHSVYLLYTSLQSITTTRYISIIFAFCASFCFVWNHTKKKSCMCLIESTKQQIHNSCMWIFCTIEIQKKKEKKYINVSFIVSFQFDIVLCNI